MLKPIRLTNTLSGKIEPLEPIAPPKLGFYACGPTVYNRAHVGNFRTFVAIDVLRRTLTHLGYRVHEVMNVTDVDDRIIQLAQQAGQDLASFTAQHIRGFEEDMKTLRIQKPEHVPRATEHIQDMIALVERLSARGHTYTADGSVYFRIASFPEYGRLSGLDAAGIQDGARVDSDKYDKENARDFVLWKFKSDEPAWAQWEAPFGHGRPGWHIECSAMSMKYLGETFDLHAGGEDLIFPHHENEIAQSESLTGKPFARYWVHTGLLHMGEEKMAHSGIFVTVKSALEVTPAPALRLYLLSQSYRTPFTYLPEQVGAAVKRWHRWVETRQAAARFVGYTPALEREPEELGSRFHQRLRT